MTHRVRGRMARVISLELARRLKAVGVEWRPAPGDHFHVPDRDLDETVFVVSDMVVEVREMPSRQRYLAFNGTTEWALDRIEQDEVGWRRRPTANAAGGVTGPEAGGGCSRGTRWGLRGP